jgi:hypothetical protein
VVELNNFEFTCIGQTCSQNRAVLDVVNKMKRECGDEMSVAARAMEIIDEEFELLEVVATFTKHHKYAWLVSYLAFITDCSPMVIQANRQRWFSWGLSSSGQEARCPDWLWFLLFCRVGVAWWHPEAIGCIRSALAPYLLQIAKNQKTSTQFIFWAWYEKTRHNNKSIAIAQNESSPCRYDRRSEVESMGESESTMRMF